VQQCRQAWPSRRRERASGEGGRPRL